MSENSKNEHKCEQMPAPLFKVRWSDIEGGAWFIDDDCEVFVAISFCPFCGVELERP